MKNQAKRITASAAALLLLGLVSCGTTGTVTSDSETEPGFADTAAEYSRLDELGAKDFGGRVFTILDANDKPATHINMPGDSMNGDIVNDALFLRDAAIESMYHADIVYEQIEGASKSASALRDSVMADDGSYDFVISVLMGGSLGTLATEGILANLTDISTLSLDRNWWSSLMYDQLRLDGKMYYTTGDISPCMYQMAGAFFLNTKLCGDYDIDTDFCGLVRNGKWTLDEVYKLTHDMNVDVNQDGVMHASDDFFGFIHQKVANGGTTTARLLLTSAGINLVEPADDEKTLVSGMNSEAALTTIEKTARLLTDVQFENQNDVMSKAFSEGRALSLIHFTSSASVYLRDMQDDYLVLPMPKADEAQETYRSYANPWMDAFVAIPKTADLDFSGFMTEAMAYYSYVHVRPMAYDLTYMQKTTRDENSAEMLNIIFDHLYLDFACITDFGGLSVKLADVLYGSADFASSMAAILPKFDEELEQFTDAWCNQ